VKEKKCQDCGVSSKRTKLYKDKKDGQTLCEKCFKYKLLIEGIIIRKPEAQMIHKLLSYYYPKNVEKQKCLLMAIDEMIDAGEKTGDAVSLTFDQIMRVARKWHVEYALLAEIMGAMLDKKHYPAG